MELYRSPFLHVREEYIPAGKRSDSDIVSLDEFYSHLEDNFCKTGAIPGAAYVLVSVAAGHRLIPEDRKEHHRREILGIRASFRNLEEAEFLAYRSEYFKSKGLESEEEIDKYLSSYEFKKEIEKALEEDSGIVYTAALALVEEAYNNPEFYEYIKDIRISTDSTKNISFKTLLGRGLKEARKFYGRDSEDNLPELDGLPEDAAAYIEVIETLCGINQYNVKEKAAQVLELADIEIKGLYRIENRVDIAVKSVGKIKEIINESDSELREKIWHETVKAVDMLAEDLAERNPLAVYELKRGSYGKKED